MQIARGWAAAVGFAAVTTLAGCLGVTPGSIGSLTVEGTLQAVDHRKASTPADPPSKGWTAQAIARIKQAPPTGGFAFVFIGDNRNKHPFAKKGDRVYQRVVEQLNQRNPLFVLHGGDFTFDATTHHWHTFEKMNQKLKPPLVTVVGNHDVIFERTHYESYYLPANRTTGLDDFSFDHDGVRFIGLDSANATLTSRQFKWLEAQLATPLRKVVVTHMPPLYRHWDHAMEDKDASKQFMAMVEAASVDYVLMSHVHLFDDTVKRGKTQYIISGGAGAPLYEGRPGRAEHHLVWMEASPAGLTHRFVPVSTPDLDTAED